MLRILVAQACFFAVYERVVDIKVHRWDKEVTQLYFQAQCDPKLKDKAKKLIYFWTEVKGKVSSAMLVKIGSSLWPKAKGLSEYLLWVKLCASQCGK